MRDEAQDIGGHERRLKKLLKIIRKCKNIDAAARITKHLLLLLLLLLPLVDLLLAAWHNRQAVQVNI